MFGVPFIVCLCATILRTEGSPIFESEYNVTDATSTESSPALICEQNAVLAENSSLYEVSIDLREECAPNDESLAVEPRSILVHIGSQQVRLRRTDLEQRAHADIDD